MRSISANELEQQLHNNNEIFLVDVREQEEHDAFNIGGILIPLGTLFENVNHLPHDRPVVFYCEKGIRSQIAIQRLQQKFQYENLLNLQGGMESWKRVFGTSANKLKGK